VLLLYLLQRVHDFLPAHPTGVNLAFDEAT
jgi:hypothetical protein